MTNGSIFTISVGERGEKMKVKLIAELTPRELWYQGLDKECLTSLPEIIEVESVVLKGAYEYYRFICSPLLFPFRWFEVVKEE